MNEPSIRNGTLIDTFEAPTNLIISISVFLEKIANFIVLAIKKAVTNTRAITPPIHIFSITPKIVITDSIYSSPKLTDDTLAIFFISLAVLDISSMFLTFTS